MREWEPTVAVVAALRPANLSFRGSVSGLKPLSAHGDLLNDQELIPTKPRGQGGQTPVLMSNGMKRASKTLLSMHSPLNSAILADLDRQLQPLAEAISRGEAVLFPCAGMTMSAGGPSWEQLVEPLKSELNPPPIETDPSLIAQFYRNKFGDHRFFTRVRETLGKKVLHPGAAHAALADLPVNVILTTNFDDLLERSLTNAGKKVHVISDDGELAMWDERSEVQLLKLHGDLDDASTIVLSEEDFHRFISRNVAMRHKLIELLRFRTVIFIGCSLRDADIDLILHETHEGSGRLTRSAYNLTFSEDPYLLVEWRRKGIEPIRIPQVPGESKGDSLARVLTRLKLMVRRIKGECDVLIVDDEELFLETTQRLIKRDFPDSCVGIEKNGYEAAKKMAVANLKPKVVFVDVCLDGPASLRGLNGFKFVDSFRNDSAYADIQFVMISCFPDVIAIPGTNISIRQKAESLGLQFIYKTDPFKDLHSNLHSIIQRHLKP